MSGDKLTVTLDLLLARMKCRLADWDDEEPRADWWAYQREYADAYAALSDTTELVEALRRIVDAPMIDHANPENSAQAIARKALTLHDRALGE